MSNDKSHQLRLSEIYGWHVYLIVETGGDYCKIGTASRPKYRIESIQNGNPRILQPVAIWHVKSREAAFLVEADALLRLDGRLRGRDWVKCNPSAAYDSVLAALTHLGVDGKRVDV